MYVTLRSLPKPSVADSGTSGLHRRRIPAAVLAFGVVSLLTDVSSESVAAVLPLYITAVLGMGPLAYGFSDGIYQGVSAAVRMLGGWWSDARNRPKWVAFVGYLASAISRVGLLMAMGIASLTAVIAVDRLGKGLRTGPRDSLIATASDPGDLGRNFGVHRAMDTAGALAGPLLAFAVLAAIPLGLGGYHAILVFSLAFAVPGVVVLALVVPDLRTAGGKAATAEGRRRRIALRLSDLSQPALRRLLLVLLLLGSFYAATDGVLSALVTQSVPEESRASGIAAAQTVVALARFACSIGFGLLWQLTSRDTALWVMAGGLAVGLVAAAALLRPLMRSNSGSPT